MNKPFTTWSLERLCPLRAKHTKHPKWLQPSDYLGWHSWAEEKSKTHRQKRCGGCGLWVIWVPKKKRGSGKARPRADRVLVAAAQWAKALRKSGNYSFRAASIRLATAVERYEKSRNRRKS